ncbi:MAG: hypothetical protein ACP5N0_01850 [Methanosarcina sp.]
MKRWGFGCSGIILLLLTAIYLLLTPVLAHVPVFGGEGTNPEKAIPVEDPAKSRVLYGQLAGGDLRYYSFEMEKGEKIVLGLTVPVEQGRKGFTPNLLLMGPGITDEGKVAEKIEVPEKYGVKVFPWILPESPVYEPFTPGAFYSLSTSDLEAPESGKYYVVVSSEQGEGNYGIVIGYKETFTLKEWISVPLNQIKIYRWEGQSLILIFAPLMIILAAGLLTLFFKRETVAGFNPARISGVFAGLFFLGTGLSFILQMLISLSKSSYSSEIVVTLVLILANIGLGVTALFLSLKNEDYGATSTRKRLYFFGLGITGLLLWAGWFLGPLLAFEAALLPWKRKG